MSYCTIIKFKNGKPFDSVEFSNSWGGMARILDVIYKEYIKDPDNPLDSWLLDNEVDRKIEELFGNNRLKWFEKAPVACLFDFAVVNKENFLRFAEDLIMFETTYPPYEKISHLPEWADTIRKLDCECIGFYHTSVTEDIWTEFDYNEKKDKPIPYNMKKHNKHFEIYRDLIDKEE